VIQYEKKQRLGKFRLQHITIDKEDVLSDWYSGVKIGTIFDEMSIIEDQRKLAHLQFTKKAQ